MSMRNLPAEWAEIDALDGLDITDKSKLVGVPFKIIGCFFRQNDKGISYCVLDVETADKELFTFQDTSTVGIRAQMVTYLTDKGKDDIIDSGEYYEFELVCPRGVRATDYEVFQRDASGREMVNRPKIKAFTYYLTTSGRRAARQSPSEKVAATPAKRTRASQS